MANDTINTAITAINTALSSKHANGLHGGALAQVVCELIGQPDWYKGASFDEDVAEFFISGGTVVTVDLYTRSIR